MPEYLAPGVYVEEQNNFNSIEGVSTSIAGFVGLTRRGRIRGLPQLVTSFNEFRRMFGGFADFGFGAAYNGLAYAVDGFFANGGQQLFIARVANGATQAQQIATGGLVTRLSVNAATGQKDFTPVTIRGISQAAGTKVRFKMLKDGVTTLSSEIAVASVNRDTGVVTLAANIDSVPAGLAEYDARYTTVLTDAGTLSAAGLVNALANTGAPRPNTFNILARDAGEWGREIVITAAHESGARATVDNAASGGPNDNIVIKVSSTSGFYTNAWIEIDRGKQKRYRKVTQVSTDNGTLIVAGPALAAADFAPDGAATTIVTVCEFRLTASFDDVTETYGSLTLESVPGRYYYDRIHNGSNLIDVSKPPMTSNDPLSFPSGPDGLNITLTGAGNLDGAVPAAADIVGNGDPGNRTGIRSLEDINDLSIIATPGLTDLVVQNALIEQCERLKDRFAILDPKAGAAGAPTRQEVTDQRNQFDTKYAALYYPRLLMLDPLSNANLVVPPSGHMAGIYARVDSERGVHKAPANEVVRDIVDFELTVNKQTQELLNPSPTNINVFRDFRGDGRGLRIWGARCITSETEWKYVNVRRLFIFLEKSIDQGTQWVVFEPNDERLWARVTQSISAFLTRVWHDGALMGTKAEEAFFVKCDRSTMTQDDLDNGRLIVLIGVAPVKPAEFVIIRIGQFTASAQNQS